MGQRNRTTTVKGAGILYQDHGIRTMNANMIWNGVRWIFDEDKEIDTDSVTLAMKSLTVTHANKKVTATCEVKTVPREEHKTRSTQHALPMLLRLLQI
jgi:hypothetical protein